MADQNQQSGTPKSKVEAKDTLSALKEALKVQGDYNNLLKDSVKDLEKSIKSYDRLGAKLSSINQTTINIKEVEKQIRENQINRFTTNQKLADLQTKLNDRQKKEADKYLGAIAVRSEKEKQLLEAQKAGDIARAKSITSAIDGIDKQIELKSSTLNVDQLSYAQAIKSNELYQETSERLKDQLKTENKINSSIGITGKTFKLFADKLGVGSEYYEDMVVKARQLEIQNKKLSFGDKLGGLGKAAVGGIKGAFSDPLTLIPIVGTALGGIVKGLKAAFDYIVGIQDQTVKFARAMNMSTQQARQLKMEFASINVSNGDLFVNTQKLVESQMEFVDALGVTNVMSSEILSTNIKLKDISGLELETRQGIAETAVITGKSSESVVKSVLAQVEGLKRVTGIQFQNQKILKEASNLGGVLGLQFAKYPEKLTKSLLTVKAMGLELKQLDSMADSFLDFESSISAEFEAQLLTGKEINLNKARELFLNNDLAGAALEINKQVGSSGDFLKMNRIQAESLAKAFGMSRDQMGDMLKRQELLSRLGAKDTDNARQQLQIGLERYKTHKALKEAVGEEAYQNMMNASMQEKIAAFMEKIKQSISDFVEKSGIIDKLEGFFDYLSKPENIKKVIEGVRNFFASAVEFIGKAAYYILEGLDYVAFGQIPDDFIDSIKSGAQNMGAQIRSLGGDLQFEGPRVSENKAKSETTTNAPATNTTVNQGFTGPQTILIENKLQTNNEVLHRSVTKAEIQNSTTKNDNATNKNVASGGQ